MNYTICYSCVCMRVCVSVCVRVCECVCVTCVVHKTSYLLHIHTGASSVFQTVPSQDQAIKLFSKVTAKRGAKIQTRK